MRTPHGERRKLSDGTPRASSGSNNSKMSNTVEKTEKTPSRIEIYGEYILLAVYYNV